MSSSIDILPQELLHHILVQLSARDVLACAATCQALYNMIRGSSLLQLVIELAVHGLRLRRHISALGANRQQTAIELLKEFRQSRIAWENLKPIRTAKIPTSRFEYEISEATLGHGLSNAQGKFRGLEFHRLWVQEGMKEAPLWRRYEDCGMDIHDFSFDHAEDLLVIVESPQNGSMTKQIHLYSLSSNEPHPLAQIKTLEAEEKTPWTQCEIRICGEILAVHFNNPHEFTPVLGCHTVWNWKSGCLISTRTGVGGYSFLSHDAMLVVKKGQDLSEPHEHTRIEIFHIDAPYSVKLNLPFRFGPSRVKVTSGRPPVECTNLPNDFYITPFMHDESAERIVMLEVDNVRLFISAKKLLKLLDDNEGILDYPLEWEEWGPEATFLLSTSNSFTGWICLDGARFFALSQSNDHLKTDEDGFITSIDLLSLSLQGGDDQFYVLMLDFNPRSIAKINGTRRDLGIAEGAKEEWHWQSASFDRPIACQLPVRIFKGKARISADELMADMNHLVSIDVGANETSHAYTVMQFTA